MARYAPLTFDSALAVPTKSTPATAAAKRGLFQRIFDAIVEARMHEAERQIARYLATRSKFTDQLEREIEQRLSGAASARNTIR